jgi:hypothetical protein
VSCTPWSAPSSCPNGVAAPGTSTSDITCIHGTIAETNGSLVHIPQGAGSFTVSGTCYQSIVTVDTNQACCGANNYIGIPCTNGTWSISVPVVYPAQLSTGLSVSVTLWDGGAGHPRDDYSLFTLISP